MPAFPLIRAVYLGIAVGAHNSAAGLARRKASGHTIGFVGRMDTEPMAAELALEGMMAAMAGNAP